MRGMVSNSIFCHVSAVDSALVFADMSVVMPAPPAPIFGWPCCCCGLMPSAVLSGAAALSCSTGRCWAVCARVVLHPFILASHAPSSRSFGSPWSPSCGAAAATPSWRRWCKCCASISRCAPAGAAAPAVSAANLPAQHWSWLAMSAEGLQILRGPIPHCCATDMFAGG